MINSSRDPTEGREGNERERKEVKGKGIERVRDKGRGKKGTVW